MSDSNTHATFEAPLPARLAPLFPGYEISNLIATGGMGAVYCAVQKSLDRTVAIKILPEEFSKDASFCEGFEAEAKAMARLNHPNLIGVYDFGEVEGMLYIIMEFVPGKSIFHSADGIAIDPAEVIRLVTGICNGLSHAHKAGIIHRDIKPSNILLDLGAEPKIGDFGLARPIERKIQEGEEIFGTPHYTAPEVVNSPHSVDYRADIFSVGVMLHELLTGKLPEADKRPASAIVRCDPRFDAIIRRATNPIPNLRYANAAEIAADLQSIATSTGPKAMRTVPAGPRPQAMASSARPPHTAPHKSRNATAARSSFPGIPLLLVAIVIALIAYYLVLNHRNAFKVSVGESNIVPEVTPPETVVTPVNAPKPEPNPISRIEPTPEPEPKPEPPPATEFEPIAQPDPSPESTPEPEPTVPAKPIFDVPAFFVKAQGIMKDRVQPLIVRRDDALKKNLTAFEREIKQAVRRIDYEWQKEHAKKLGEDLVSDCENNGNRIPKVLNWKFREIRQLRDLHGEFYGKQQTIEKTLLTDVSGLAATYILGLEKQVERLTAANDTAAIALVEEEIQQTRSDPSHFQILMLGPPIVEKSAEEVRTTPKQNQ